MVNVYICDDQWAKQLRNSLLTHPLSLEYKINMHIVASNDYYDSDENKRGFDVYLLHLSNIRLKDIQVLRRYEKNSMIYVLSGAYISDGTKEANEMAGKLVDRFFLRQSMWPILSNEDVKTIIEDMKNYALNQK